MTDSTTDKSSGPVASPEEPSAPRPVKFLALLACVCLFVMMVITFVDVLGRYLFLKPLPAAYEIISLIMPAIIFLALPLSVVRNSHVTVDLLDSLTPKRFAEYRSIVIDLICAGTMLLLSWRLAIRSSDQHRYEEVSDELVLEVWPFSAAMAVLCAITALVFLARFWARFRARLRGTSHGARTDQEKTE